MKGITLCADCAYYNMKKHKCTRGCKIDPDVSKGENPSFYVDCPLPDVEPLQKWIPCSERLPELKKDHESDCVLCYCDTGAYAFSTLQENFFGQVGFACEKEDDYYHSIGKVIAWMPLPEPPESEVQE